MSENCTQYYVDQLGWFSLISALEASLVENFGSPNSIVKGLKFFLCIMV
jgi:hypothetical protein